MSEEEKKLRAIVGDWDSFVKAMLQLFQLVK